MEVTPLWHLVLSAVLFSIGAVGMLVRRNALVMFMSIELMLNAVNLTFVATSRRLGILEGQIAVLFCDGRCRRRGHRRSGDHHHRFPQAGLGLGRRSDRAEGVTRWNL